MCVVDTSLVHIAVETQSYAYTDTDTYG